MFDLPALTKGAAEVIDRDALADRLRRGKPLAIKAGFDPTAPDLHLGHTVVLNRLRAFQDQGHKIDLVIGDFTGMIGDPSGRNVMRPPLTREEVEANAATYTAQVFKTLDEARTTVHFNSAWLGALAAAEVVKLAATYTVARMLERDDFSKRYAQERPISLHEFLYPLMQGYDSVALNTDVELGGADQKFNLLVGRAVQKGYGQEPQIVMTTPLLEGLDGERKMSKSLDNYIGIDEPPDEMFGKLMSASDELMWRYFELLSFRAPDELERLRAAVADGRNPRDVKFELALEITARFHDAAAAERAQRAFIDRFRRHLAPEDMDARVLSADEGDMPLAVLLKLAGLAPSTSEALRLLRQGAVRIDGERVADADRRVAAGAEHVYQVGKRRFCRVSLRRGAQ